MMAEQKLPEEGQTPQEKSKETWQSLGSVIPFKPKKTTQSEEKRPVKRHLQLVNLAGDLAKRTREEAGALGFMSRLLIMVNLPYRDPGKDTRTWWRKNGNVSIDVNSGTENGVPIGLPYGAYPRLILAYLITQAVKTQNPTIYLGKSFSKFLEAIGITKGGKQYKILHKQLERTLFASFSWTYRTDKQLSRTNIQVSNQSQLWWDEKELNQQSLWESYIELNHHFFKEIIRNAVPLDLRVLAGLKNSPLGLDLYMFIAWRTFKINEPVHLSWESLHQQLGTLQSTIPEFARECKTHIQRIQSINPTLKITFLRGRLCLYPSLPSKARDSASPD